MPGVSFRDVGRSTTTRPSPSRALDLDVADGELLVLVGPSGCGKTTALRMVAGLEEITRRRHLHRRATVNGLSPSERNVAMVFQNYALYPHMTVRANMALALKIRGRSGRARRAGRGGGGDARARASCWTASRPSSRAGSASAWRWAGRSCATRASSCSTSRCRTSTRSCACTCAPRSPSCSARSRATTIFVTHDQVEAMTMARPRRRHAQGGAAAGRAAAGALRAAGEPLRRRLHRLAADEPPRAGPSQPATAASPFATAARGEAALPLDADAAARLSQRRRRGDRRHPAEST